MGETIPNIAGLLPAPSDMAGGDYHFNEGLLHDGKMVNRLNGNNQNTVLPDYQSGADEAEMVKLVVRKFGNYAPKAPRMPDGTIQLVCHDEDFHTAINIADTLIEHAKSVYRKLAVSEKQKEFLKKENRAAARRKRLYDVLPDEFTKADYDKAVADINENPCTAAKWIDVFIRSGQLKRQEQGHYVKVITTDAQQEQMSIN